MATNARKSKTPSKSKAAAPPISTAPTRQNMIELVLESLDDAKAENTVSIDMIGKSPLSDHMVVTSGRSHRHVGAMADQLTRALKTGGYGAPRVEGLTGCDWVLVDAGDVIVHIFRPEVREFYNLEKMWLTDLPAEAH